MLKIDFHRLLCFFLVFNHDFGIYIDFTHVAASNTLLTLTPQIRSHTKYLIQIRNILLLILYSKLMRNVAAWYKRKQKLQKRKY